MAIGNSYPVRPVIQAQDLFLGTRYGSNSTVNYTTDAIVDYLNTNASIAVGGQLTFQFLISTYGPKSIFFSAGGGDGTSFSSITQLIISSTDCSGSLTNIFVNYLVGKDILLSQQNTPNSFAQYKITSYTVTATPGFYTLNLQYIGGNGNIGKDLYYTISQFFVNDIPVTPTLQSVTDAGNTTTNNILITDLIGDSYSVIGNAIIGSFDVQNGTYSKLYSDGFLGLNYDGVTESYLVPGITQIALNYPVKPAGTYTIATTADIPSVTGFVPYTGATQDVDLGEFEIKAGQVEFDQTPTGTAGVGVMRWNDSDGTVDLGLKGGNVTLQIGQEQVLRVVNKTATNINLLEANYQAVRVTGTQGQRLKVDLALATTDPLSAETLGLVTETINNNQEGFITTSGLVRGINTTGSLQGETWADGDILYLSPTTAGRATKVKPVAPNHLIILGYVIHAHITQGSIFVKVDNGYELDELHNVKITTPVNNNVLAYTSATDIWENKTINTVIGYTPFQLPALTSGSVLFSNGTTIAQDNSNLFWDDTNNRLGIGTASPAYGLDVNGTTRFQGVSLINSGLGAVSTNAINVTGASGTLFSVRGFGDALVASTLYLGAYSGSNFIAAGTIGITSNQGTGSQFIRFTHNNSNNAFRILSNSNIELNPVAGNILIGTTTDAGFKLDVNGTARVSGVLTVVGNILPSAGGTYNVGSAGVPFSNGFFINTVYSNQFASYNSHLYFANSGVNFARITNTTGNFIIQNGGTFTDAGYRLDVNGTARVSGNCFLATSSGNVGIGTTSSSYKLTIAQDGYNLRLANTPNSQGYNIGRNVSDGILYFYGEQSGFNGYAFTGINGERMRVATSGNILINTTTDIASSKLTVESTTQGFLPPRMTTTQKNAISTPAAGLVVYDTTLNKLCLYTTTWETITSI